MRLLPKWLVGDGSLPENERATIAGEGQLFLEEGLRGTISYLHFRTRGRRYGKAVRWTDFSIGVSEKRVLVYEHSGHTKVVDVPFDDPRGAALDVSLDEDKVVIHIDLDRFGTPNAHGQITIRIPTPNAQRRGHCGRVAVPPRNPLVAARREVRVVLGRARP